MQAWLSAEEGLNFPSTSRRRHLSSWLTAAGRRRCFLEREEERMLQSGWTRTEVAAALDVTPRTLYNWEREGKIPAPERDRRGWRRYTEEQVAGLRQLLGVTSPPTVPGREH